MAANFELSSIPGGVFVSGSLDVTELCFVGCVVVVNVERNFNCIDN